MEGDKGLIVKNKAAHHAISAKFPEKIDPKGKPLVVQYEVKLQSMFSALLPNFRVWPPAAMLTHFLCRRS